MTSRLDPFLLGAFPFEGSRESSRNPSPFPRLPLLSRLVERAPLVPTRRLSRHVREREAEEGGKEERGASRAGGSGTSRNSTVSSAITIRYMSAASPRAHFSVFTALFEETVSPSLLPSLSCAPLAAPVLLSFSFSPRPAVHRSRRPDPIEPRAYTQHRFIISDRFTRAGKRGRGRRWGRARRRGRNTVRTLYV